ncbi:hypothetical protein BS47DRAFT_1489217 [Hydnum rufescens UP504]|uniref:Uncharacterized protein n=1 Tax=Hydnum rufescens UP504 TaxID=1448309 RepID=A0A9P6AJ02_9AGAM|nr:hypothetical protein BS47DRAFT_1489217 [Hydnum rufescens UP504]
MVPIELKPHMVAPALCAGITFCYVDPYRAVVYRKFGAIDRRQSPLIALSFFGPLWPEASLPMQGCLLLTASIATVVISHHVESGMRCGWGFTFSGSLSTPGSNPRKEEDLSDTPRISKSPEGKSRFDPSKRFLTISNLRGLVSLISHPGAGLGQDETASSNASRPRPLITRCPSKGCLYLPRTHHGTEEILLGLLPEQLPDLSAPRCVGFVWQPVPLPLSSAKHKVDRLLRVLVSLKVALPALRPRGQRIKPDQMLSNAFSPPPFKPKVRGGGARGRRADEMVSLGTGANDVGRLLTQEAPVRSHSMSYVSNERWIVVFLGSHGLCECDQGRRTNEGATITHGSLLCSPLTHRSIHPLNHSLGLPNEIFTSQYAYSGGVLTTDDNKVEKLLE